MYPKASYDGFGDRYQPFRGLQKMSGLIESYAYEVLFEKNDVDVLP